jgi:galactokinase
MAASHASMRDDFEITVPAVDRLVAIIEQALAGTGGCRMTGGGFGGCVVALMPLERVAAVQQAVQQHYRSPQGQQAQVFVCEAGPGAGPVDL